jgi:hypothetical protein
MGKRVRSRIRWMLKGDAITKEFFQAVGERPESATNTELAIHALRQVHCTYCYSIFHNPPHA